MGLIENTKEIRICVSEEYGQQDAIQFMEDLLNKCETLQNLYYFKTRETLLCQNCNNMRSKDGWLVGCFFMAQGP